MPSQPGADEEARRALTRAAALISGGSGGVRDIARRAAGTAALQGMPDAVAALEGRIGEVAFALREQAEATERLGGLAADLVTTLRLQSVESPGETPTPASPPLAITIATPAMLARVRVLHDSLHAHAPDWMVRVVLVGTGPAPSALPGVELTSVIELLGLEPEALLVEHPWEELVTLLVPRVLSELTQDAGVGPAVHLPVSTWVLGDLRPLAQALASRPVLLAARTPSEPAPDGLEPSSQRLDRVGRIDPQLIGVDGSPLSRDFLGWWSARLEGVTGPPGVGPGHRRTERATALRSLELAALWPQTSVLRDPAMRLTAENALVGPLRHDDGRLQAGGRPVSMIDLPAFDPTRPFRLDPWSSRVRLSTLPALANVVGEYARALRAAGWRDTAQDDSIGLPITGAGTFDADLQAELEIARALDADLLDPFSPAGAVAFADWLRAPSSRGGEHGVTRHLRFMVARHRRDVALAYPDPEGSDAADLVQWARRQGAAELRIEPMLAEPAIAPAAPPPPAAGPRDRGRSAPSASPRVRVSGYVGHVLGLGAAARGYAEALSAAGVDVRTRGVSLDRLRPAVDQGAGYGAHGYAEGGSDAAPDADIICVNPGELAAFVDRVDPGDLTRPRIGVWGWETDTVPPNWAPAHALVDEVWVYSRFVADNLAAITDRPIAVLPPPVPIPAPASPQRLGVADGFLFLFIFDYSSTIQRKNPVGLIEAFTRAFAPDEGPRLLIKTINAGLLPLAHEEVLWAAGDRPDVHVIDRSLTDTERDGLIAACDCYVSLHRSEGFGLTMAEAMAIGKPVIATGWSGNIDFMNADNSLLVDSSLVHVGPQATIYPADGTWAQPDLGHAATLMRRVHADPRSAAALGARARQDIGNTLSPTATGSAMRRRLEQVLAGSRRRT